MSQERSSGISATGIILIVLACVGVGVLICAGVIVVCLVAITALGTSANATFGTVGTKIELQEDRRQAEQAAKEFIADLGNGLTQAAWDQTSADFQARHIKEGGPDQSKYFADFLKEHPGLKNPSAIEVRTQNFSPNQASLQATITAQSGKKVILSLKLTKEMEINKGIEPVWKISDLSVLDDGKATDAGKKKKAPSKEVARD